MQISQYQKLEQVSLNMKRIYNVDFILKAIAMSNKRGSISTTAQELNINIYTLIQWRSKYWKGKFTETLPSPPKNYSLEFKLDAIAMSNKKGSINSIAQQLGITRNNLMYWRSSLCKNKFAKDLLQGEYSLGFKLNTISMSNAKNAINTTVQQLGITKINLEYWRVKYSKDKLIGIPSIVKSRKAYSLEFKLKAIAMSNKKGTIVPVAQLLGISKYRLVRWRIAYRKGEFVSPEAQIEKVKNIEIIQLKKECRRLEKELEEIKQELNILKAGREYLFKKPREKYVFIKENISLYSISKMCKALKIGSAGYHRWLKRKPSKQLEHNKILEAEVRRIYIENKGRYGCRRIAKELQIAGFKTNQTSVGLFMVKAGLKRKVKQKYQITTNSSHKYPVMNNILMQKFSVTRSNEVWVSDITYIYMKNGGWIYLTIVLDLFDRKVIGWTLSQTLKAKDTTVEAFKKALLNRPIQESNPLIFHSDRGTQYACKEFVTELKKCPSIVQSMSRKHTFWDNAVAESFFSRIKAELINQNTYHTKKDAEQSIFDYIENYYNICRRHSALNNLTILEFHKLIGDDV
ncbi:IS3 family transposase [Flavobacterium sp.]|uniref:IS3 family transposase n=1 Tax=Flavobacterium sp. TaxID=239 RepID=UPI003D6A1979